jgi:hypothetical protein
LQLNQNIIDIFDFSEKVVWVVQVEFLDSLQTHPADDTHHRAMLVIEKQSCPFPQKL